MVESLGSQYAGSSTYSELLLEYTKDNRAFTMDGCSSHKFSQVVSIKLFKVYHYNLRLFLGLILCSSLAYAKYDFPIKNPFFATIATSPPEFRPQLIDEKEILEETFKLKVFPKRKLPKNLWDVAELPINIAWQEKKAPIIVIIAGTGGSYNEQKMEYLKKLFYGAGLHVLQISSPTNYDFIASASTSFVPGISQHDAVDLYYVIQQAFEYIKVNHSIDVSKIFLTGYSLGALDAAYLGDLDARKKRINFSKILLLNPPVNLYTSITNLDKMIHAKIPGIESAEQFFNHIFNKLAKFFAEYGRINVDDALLFDLQGSGHAMTREEMAALIGIVFRFAVADMNFTSNQLGKTGIYLPVNQRVTVSTSLTRYLRRVLICDFECYVQQRVYPYWKQENPTKTLNDLMNNVSLYRIQSFLSRADYIGVMTNADDFILGEGDLQFIKDTFQAGRYTIYPYGGHCGNLNYKQNARDILAFFELALSR
ncbi:serine/threonine protein kinase [Zooshikella ganghwensis]|uniref:serine/threonine protein kinase n=1 Tax=Zooshikella ganghwensis TaxID=202772 RepID=UPI00146F9AA0|nr:serine/threonine protein kinase [Zooshikella ganghwensis]